jgi:hypothetical protein
VGGRAFPQVSISYCSISTSATAKRKVRLWPDALLLAAAEELWRPEDDLCLEECPFALLDEWLFDCDRSDQARTRSDLDLT